MLIKVYITRLQAAVAFVHPNISLFVSTATKLIQAKATIREYQLHIIFIIPDISQCDQAIHCIRDGLVQWHMPVYQDS